MPGNFACRSPMLSRPELKHESQHAHTPHHSGLARSQLRPTRKPAENFLTLQRAQSLLSANPVLSLACPLPRQPTGQTGRQALKHSRTKLESSRRSPEMKLMPRPFK